MERWAARAGVLESIGASSQLVDGDCKGEQVFPVGGGYRVVDWQCPYRAPAGIDLATLLEAREIDPLPHASPAAFGIRWLLHLHRALEGKVRLLPRLTLFDGWAETAVRSIRRAAAADPVP